MRPGRAARGVQVPGGGAGRGGLGGPLLDLAQLGDGLGERGQPGDQHERGERQAGGQAGGRGDEPGGPAQLVPGRARGRDPARATGSLAMDRSRPLRGR